MKEVLAQWFGQARLDFAGNTIVLPDAVRFAKKAAALTPLGNLRAWDMSAEDGASWPAALATARSSA